MKSPVDSVSTLLLFEANRPQACLLFIPACPLLDVQEKMAGSLK